MSSDSDSLQTDSDEGEWDESGELSHLGAAATVKMQPEQQRSFHLVKRGTDDLARQVLETCELTNLEVVPTSTRAATAELSSLVPGTESRVLQQNIIFQQQQFGDVTVHGTRNLTIGGTQNIGSSEPDQEKKEKPHTWTEKILNHTIERMESWVQGMVRTAALEKVMEKLKTGTRWITIKGSPGEGKSTVAYMALKELHNTGRQVFQVTSPKEFTEVITTCTQPVIMLDDIFGNLEFDLTKWNKWESALHRVLDEKEHRSHEQGEITSTKDVSVILVGRDYVLNTASCDLGRIADFFTQDTHVVCMSHSVEREHHEKMSIWKAISLSGGVELEKDTIDTICHISCPHGFPHVCRLFVTMLKKDPKLSAETFFKSPLEFLNQTVIKFMRNKSKLLLFKEMLKGDGKVSVREQGKLDSGSESMQTAYDLVGTYLKKEDDYFLFDHPSIYDSVAYNLCSIYPQFVIETCNLSFIRERLRLEPSRNMQHDTPSRESGLVVYIPRSCVGDLAKRFAAEILNDNLAQILSHKALSDDDLTNKVMSQLKLPLHELMKRKDKKSAKTFLSLLASNKSPSLLKYVSNHLDRNLTQDEINTVLYGVCKYAASDVLVYLSNTCVTLDINVRYGYGGLTPLMIAARTRDSQFVHQIMSLNPDLNARDQFDKTAFHYLCENGIVSAVKQMIDKGTDIDVKNLLGRSPLSCACRSNQVEVVRLLLDNKARIDEQTVHNAIETRNIQLVKLLFERGATVDMAQLQPLLLSARGYGSLRLVQYLIEKGANVNTHEMSNNSPLHWACVFDNFEVVKYLLDHGAVLDSRNLEGNTPLHKAAGWGSKDCVDVLLKAGADMNVQNKDDYTALHRAVEGKSKECVDVLLKAGADVNVQNKYGDAPLHQAVERGSKECVNVLLKGGADMNVQSKYGNTPLHIAVEGKSKECVDVLLKAGADVNVQNKYGDAPLHQAVERGSKECVDVLLKGGADMNVQSKYGNTPLHIAVERGSKECVDVLLKAGADVNVQIKDGNTPLHIAVESESKECVDVLLKAGADVNVQNEDDYTALHIAVESESKECVDVLLKTGADVNIQSKYGNTPLHRAAWRESKESVDVLLKAGADVNIQSKDGNTPLHRAAWSESKECVDVLLKAGADVNVQNEDDYTALHIAVESESKECVDVLLKTGADVNVQIKDGDAPLHRAVQRRSKECVDMLLKAGADVNVQNKYGDAPLHQAVERGSKECVDVLLKAGADVNILNTRGQSPLHTSVYYKSTLGIHPPYVSLCETLIRHGANINKPDTEVNTPLHLVCRVDSHTEIYDYWLNEPASFYKDVYRRLVTLLVDNGADKKIHNNRGESALRGWCQTLIGCKTKNEI